MIGLEMICVAIHVSCVGVPFGQCPQAPVLRCETGKVECIFTYQGGTYQGGPALWCVEKEPVKK